MQEESHRQIFVPSPEATEVASLGFELVVADLLWTRAVLLFVDFLNSESDQGRVWTRTVLQTVNQRARSVVANTVLLRRKACSDCSKT